MPHLEQEQRISVDGTVLPADVRLPDQARGVVLFAHGSGSSRHSPRNQAVAERLRRERFGTVLADLLTEPEEREDEVTARLRFDIGLLADRLVGIIGWLSEQPDTYRLPIGLFGASTGAAGALVAAARAPQQIQAVVSRGGRPDLAGDDLHEVRAPTLLIVGGRDTPVLQINEQVLDAFTAPVQLHVVPGATHLFPEPGTLEEVADEAAAWFAEHLQLPH
ncbi:MAG: dienelactone hydrolase family protein [Micromonosporaceae bacterium]